jgi:hypothetical protein
MKPIRKGELNAYTTSCRDHRRRIPSVEARVFLLPELAVGRPRFYVNADPGVALRTTRSVYVEPEDDRFVAALLLL